MGVKEDIIKYCKTMNIDSVGFVKCRVFEELKELYIKRKISHTENEFEENDIDLRIDSEKWFKGGKTIVTIAFPYLSLYENIDNGFSVYTKAMDYHLVLNKYLKEIAKIINNHGGKTECFVDSNTLPERYIAYLGGVGFIGKNNMIITEKYGSYVFLGEVITDLEFFEEDKRNFKEIDQFKECGECSICYEECPSKAINNARKNCNICLSYLTQKKELQESELKLLNGRIFGCDSCQAKCPYNENASYTKIEEFKKLEFMNENNEDFIINMGNSDFKNTFKKASCGWRGKNVLKRNAIIRKSNYLKKNISNIKSDSPYIQKYIDVLLKDRN